MTGFELRGRGRGECAVVGRAIVRAALRQELRAGVGADLRLLRLVDLLIGGPLRDGDLDDVRE